MPRGSTDNPQRAALLRAADQLADELEQAKRRPLSAPLDDGVTSDELIAALRADRDSW